jgi:hypothetical protein
MYNTLKLINQLVRDSEPDDYDSVTFNSYLEHLANIADSLLYERENMKQQILKVEDIAVRTKLLELI